MQWKEFRSHIRHLSVENLQRVEHAFELGKDLHEGQTRKSGQPYFSHPIAVADMLADMGADADTIIAALLHDTIEDTPLTLEEVEKEFGKTVAMLIDGVTKLPEEEFAGEPSMDEQVETLRKIFTLMQQDVRIMVIKLVDRLHNMQTVEFLPKERQKMQARETSDVYVKIADRLCMLDLRNELEALCLSVLEPNLFAKLSAIRAQNEKHSLKVMERMQERIRKAFPSFQPDVHYEYKKWSALRAQLDTEANTVTGLSALTTVFLCKDIEACYQTLGTLHQIWPRETHSFRDFINSPMINGYKGIRTIMILEDGTRVRCKMRTREMHEYAHRGITTMCFDSEAMGLLDYLPWAERISPLAEDTAKHSEEFWQSLKSDILGESIVVHSLGVDTVLLPKGATALDGAFYCFGQDALRAISIKVNGKEVPFQSPLTHGVSLDIEFGKRDTVQREWLNWVQTGIAMAQIRSALGKKSEKTKLHIGKQMLQDLMNERKKGLIDEFDEKSLTEKLKSIGHESLEEAYIAIADGHLQPSELYEALFETKKKATSKAEQQYVVSYSFPLDDIDIISGIVRIYQKYRFSPRKIRFWYNPLSGKATVRVRVALTPKQQQSIVTDVRATGATHVEIAPPESRILLNMSIGSLIALWGLDPVFANFLLERSLTAFDLTVLRALIFFIAASIMFGIFRIRTTQKFKPLSPAQPTMILSGITLFITALLSYLALSYIHASHYILFIIGGLVTANFIKAPPYKKRLWRLLVPLGIILASLIWLFSIDEGFSYLGILFGIGSSLSFMLYSEISRRYQMEKGMIQARYPAFLFWLSVIGLPLMLLLIPFTHIRSLPLFDLQMAIGFVLIFALLPYSLFYELMKRMEPDKLNHLLLFVVFSTIVGESLMTKSWVHIAASPILLVFLWQYLMLRKSP